LISLSRSPSPRRIAPLLYGKLVAAARAPAFYRDLNVPDTIEGRYEMIALHAALLLRRVREDGRKQAALAQAVLDFMAADWDRSIRELGVGDLSVARYMKRLGEGFYGRASAYDETLLHSDESAVSEALLRNIYGGTDPGGQILAVFAAYVTSQARHLSGQPSEAIAAGQIDFLSLNGDAA
jgi:cytochrome b pre-mRNA-processing protein 3